MRNPLIEIDEAEKYPHDKNREIREKKQANKIFNEVRQFTYILGVREREIFIDSTINTRKYQRDTLRDTIHEGSNPHL